MSSERHKYFIEYGINVLRSRHSSIRKLKRLHRPSLHGFRVWPSSWLLIDYFKLSNPVRHSRVLDIGCGWGLAGIYCAKNHSSKVTCVDRDSEVFPYVQLHAEINNVEITAIKTGFETLSGIEMKSYEIMIGADICFWVNMVDTLKSLIHRAFESNIKSVIIADPGRSPFEMLAQYFVNTGIGKIMNWNVTHPYPIQGRILIIR